MVAYLSELAWAGSEQSIGFAQGERRLLFVAVDRANGEAPRRIQAQLIDRDGNDDRFSGMAGGSVFSLVSTSGALMVGMLGESDVTGSLVYPNGHGHRFTVELSNA